MVEGGPGLRDEVGERDGGLSEEGDEDAGPAASEDADEAEAGGPSGAAGNEQGGVEVREQGGVVGIGRPADADEPEGGDGDGEPEAGGAIRVGHAGALPLPAGPLGHLEALLDPGAQAVPGDVGDVGRQVGQDQPG